MISNKAVKYLLVIGPMLTIGGALVAAEPEKAPALELSEHLRGFLKHEMGALATAGRAIETALAAGDSETVATYAAQMDKAFIFKQDVTTLDLRELEAVLGEDFVAQDKAFHAMGRELEAAAKTGDTEVEKQIFARMLHACAACHNAYAPEAPVLE